MRAEVEGQFHPFAFILSTMSCETSMRQMALVAVQGGGIPVDSSKKGFFVGATLAGTFLGGLLFSYQRRRRQGRARSATKTTAAPPARLPKSPILVETTPAREAQTVITWKRNHRTWQVLEGVWAQEIR